MFYRLAALLIAYCCSATLAYADNTAPNEAFSAFSKFELSPATMGEAYQGNEANDRSRTNLDHNLGLTLQPQLESWTNDKGSRTLVIQPHIKGIRFIGTAARIWFGMMGGSSWIVVKVSFVDKDSGEQVGSALFFRSAKGNGISGPRRDYKMIETMAADITSYMQANYDKAVGGVGNGIYPPEKFLKVSKG